MNYLRFEVSHFDNVVSGSTYMILDQFAIADVAIAASVVAILFSFGSLTPLLVHSICDILLQFGKCSARDLTLYFLFSLNCTMLLTVFRCYSGSYNQSKLTTTNTDC